MAVVRTILTVLFFVIGAIIVILAFMQTKEDEGLSSTITGSSTNNFYEKNKARTKEGKQKYDPKQYHKYDPQHILPEK